jgi:hypothetical protein
LLSTSISADSKDGAEDDGLAEPDAVCSDETDEKDDVGEAIVVCAADKGADDNVEDDEGLDGGADVGEKQMTPSSSSSTSRIMADADDDPDDDGLDA